MRIIFVVISLLLVTACVHREEQIVLDDYLPPAEQRIMVVGDSLSNGYGMARHEGWVALLQERVTGSGEGYRIINVSRNGATTFVGRNNILNQLALNGPDIVIVALGGNDALLRLPMEKVRANLEYMLANLQARKIKTLLVGVRIPERYDHIYAAEFSAMYEQLAKQYSVPVVIHILDGVYGQDGYMQQDGVHPSRQAQSRMLENVWPKLSMLLD